MGHTYDPYCALPCTNGILQQVYQGLVLVTNAYSHDHLHQTQSVRH